MKRSLAVSGVNLTALASPNTAAAAARQTSEIYSMNTDGSALTRLTTNEAIDRSPN